MLSQQVYEIDTFLLMRIMKAGIFNRGLQILPLLIC